MPNLFEADELEKIIILTRPAAKEAGLSEENRDEIYNLFVSRVRNHLHIVLCMSPAGDAFRWVLLMNYSCIIYIISISKDVIAMQIDDALNILYLTYLRRRCRMFPSLVNCCTIDWFTKWPDEALLSVAKISIVPDITQDLQLASSLASICMLMHQVYQIFYLFIDLQSIRVTLACQDDTPPLNQQIRVDTRNTSVCHEF